jgi:hypothetical protein
MGRGSIGHAIEFLGNGSVSVAVGRGGRGRQAEEVRGAVITTPVQERCAAENDRWALGTRPEQHRQHAKEHVVSDNDVGRELLQNLLQTLVLRGNAVDEETLQRNAQPFQAGRNLLQLRRY